VNPDENVKNIKQIHMIVVRARVFAVKLADSILTQYTIFEKDISIGPTTLKPEPNERKNMAKWLALFPKLVANGQFKSNPVRKCPGSLEHVHEALGVSLQIGVRNALTRALKYLEAGKASAQKFVYSVKGEFSPAPPALQ
jgi:hypothetical protein